MLADYDLASIEKITKNAIAENKKDVSIKFSNETAFEYAQNNLFDGSHDIFNILHEAASANPALNDESIKFSFNHDINVIYINFVYK